MPLNESEIDQRMRELEEEVRRTLPPDRVDGASKSARALVPSDSTQSDAPSRGILPSLGLVAVLAVGGIVAWYVVKHVIVTLFWVAAIGVLGWLGWKFWRKKKGQHKSK